jgi:GntR family transcriptional repressor for pyruvate dehydrogenase complex
LPDQLAERLQRLIAEKHLQPGARLPAMSTLAARFRVGYPTLREGLKKLEALGVISIHHGSGVYVRQPVTGFFLVNPISAASEPTRKVFLDLIEARKTVEMGTIALAAEKITPEQSAQLGRLLKEAHHNLENHQELNRINTQIHLCIAAASGNSVLTHLLEAILEMFKDHQRQLLDIRGLPGSDYQEHAGLVDAVRRRRKALALARMRKHLEGFRQAVLNWGSTHTNSTEGR